MKIEIQVDEQIEETKVVIYAKQMNSEINEIMKKLSKTKEAIKVYKDDETYFLKEDDIESIYTENSKVYIKCEKDIYQSKNRLYELEEMISKEKFLRISNSEIINFDKVKKINTKLLGTICINFKSGYQTYASRRYIKKIKEFLNI